MYCDPSGFAKNPMCDKDDVTNKTYYQVITQQNAEQIIKSGQLKNGKWKSYVYVYAWTQQPTRKEASVAEIGKEATTVLKFKTKASFTADVGNVDIPKIKDKVVQTVVVQRLPIEITDIETVGFKKEWWKFWKK